MSGGSNKVISFSRVARPRGYSGSWSKMSETTMSKPARVIGFIALRTTWFSSLDRRDRAVFINRSFSDFEVLGRLEALGLGVPSLVRLEDRADDMP